MNSWYNFWSITPEEVVLNQLRGEDGFGHDPSISIPVQDNLKAVGNVIDTIQKCKKR